MKIENNIKIVTKKNNKKSFVDKMHRLALHIDLNNKHNKGLQELQLKKKIAFKQTLWFAFIIFTILTIVTVLIINYGNFGINTGVASGSIFDPDSPNAVNDKAYGILGGFLLLWVIIVYIISVFYYRHLVKTYTNLPLIDKPKKNLSKNNNK